MDGNEAQIIIFLVISMAACFGAGILRKIFLLNSSGTATAILTFNSIGGAVSALVLLLWGGFGDCSIYTFFIGILFGIITGSQGVALIFALKCGPFAYTNVLVSFSTLITALSGVLFFGEDALTVAQIIGIALMLTSFILANEKGEDEKRTSKAWLALAVLAFSLTGGIGLMQKIHQTSEYKGELNAFLIIAFITIAIILIPAIIFFDKQEKKGTEGKTEKSDSSRSLALLAMMIAGGAFVAANHKLNLYLSGVMPSAVFFPVVNGGELVLATLAAVFIFREKLSRKQWIGIVLGTLSVVLVCNPFG